MLNLRAPDFKQNPYQFFKHLRTSAPVCRIEPHGFFAVFRHMDVANALKNPEIFSSAGINEEPCGAGPELLLSTRGLLSQDRPNHTRLRKRLGRAFTTDTINSLQPYIEDATKTLIKDMLHQECIDFVKDFSAHLPIMIICHLLGLDPSRRAEIKGWSDTMLSWRASAHSEEKILEVKAKMNEFYHFIMEAIHSKKQQPQSDVISFLLHAQNHNDELSMEEILSFIRLLIVAGTDTTTHLLGNTILAFIKFPDLYTSIKTNPDIIPHLIEESLRFDSPVQCVMRRASVNTEIAQVQIKKDELVLLFVGSANHDETVYDNPHRFIIDRTPQHHLTFGAGIHSCIGSQIARLQARIALQQLLPYFDIWQRADSAPLEYFNSIFFRGLTTLKVKHN